MFDLPLFQSIKYGSNLTILQIRFSDLSKRFIRTGSLQEILKIGFILVIACLLIPKQGVSQQDSVQVSGLSLQTIAEFYYCYDVGLSHSGRRQPFLYSYNDHDEPGINLGVIKLSGNYERMRFNAGAMAGTYATENLRNESRLARHINELNAGIKLHKSTNIWLDAGVIPSHIGFEFPVSHGDNWTLTRSLMAENSPYYESGAKLTFTSESGNWMLAFLALNGWQSIRSQPIVFGHQLQYRSEEQFVLNSSSIVGKVEKLGVRVYRLFHNAFIQGAISPGWEWLAGFDIGWEERMSSNGFGMWNATVVQSRMAIRKKWYVSGRFEQYNDRDGIIVGYYAPKPFHVTGATINLDYKMKAWLMWRMEGRLMKGTWPYFHSNGSATEVNSIVALSCIVGR